MYRAGIAHTLVYCNRHRWSMPNIGRNAFTLRSQTVSLCIDVENLSFTACRAPHDGMSHVHVHYFNNNNLLAFGACKLGDSIL